MALGICANGRIDQPFAEKVLEYVCEKSKNAVLGENLRKFNV